MHITMDFLTFLATCTGIVTAGGTTIAIMRIIKGANGRILKNETGQIEMIPLGKAYSIVREKIQEFYNGTCRSERSAIREVMRTEVGGIREILRIEIRQMNETLTKGLENIKEEIKNGNSGTGPESGKTV